jgi:hypothetical protein
MTDSRPRNDRPVAVDSQSEHSTTAPGVGAGVYSQALEQQFALVRQLLSPRGPSLLQDPAGELLVRNDLARDARWRARSIAGDVSHASPFFWTVPLACADVSGARARLSMRRTER